MARQGAATLWLTAALTAPAALATPVAATPVTPAVAVLAAADNAINDGPSRPAAATDAETTQAGTPRTDAQAQAGMPHTDAQAEAIMRTPRFRGLAAELRCLVCQNQTLLDSHADLAKDLRMEVVRLIQEGHDDAEVKRYLVDRYGEFVLYRPTWSWRNGVLWLGPLALLAVAGGTIWRLTRRHSPIDSDLDAADDAEDVEDDDTAEDEDSADDAASLPPEEALKQVDALLARQSGEDAPSPHEDRRQTGC